MAKDKNAGRRRRGAVIYTPVAVLLIALIAIFGISVFFRITAIEISGTRKYTVEQIQSVSGIKLGDNLIFVKKQAVSETIGLNLPYLSEVVVTKIIPNKIVISVTESQPLAAIKYDKDWYIIDQKAKVLEKTTASGLSDKIRVTGLEPVKAGEGVVLTVGEADRTKLKYMISVLSALESAGMGDKVSALDVSNIAYITFEYDGRFTVLFGSGDNAVYKMDWLLKIIEQLDTNDRGKIDVSSDEAAARFIPE
jgi:cell division protein FtsQ